MKNYLTRIITLGLVLTLLCGMCPGLSNPCKAEAKEVEGEVLSEQAKEYAFSVSCKEVDYGDGQEIFCSEPENGHQKLDLYWQETNGYNNMQITGVGRDQDGTLVISMRHNVAGKNLMAAATVKYYLYTIDVESTDITQTEEVIFRVSTVSHNIEETIIYDDNGEIDLEKTRLTQKEYETDEGTVDYKKAFVYVCILHPRYSRIKIVTKRKSVKASKLKKKAMHFQVKYIQIGNGKVTFKKMSGSKKLSISPIGKIKIRKGTKKGTYKIKVIGTISATSTYRAASTTKTIKVKVK